MKPNEIFRRLQQIMVELEFVQYQAERDPFLSDRVRELQEEKAELERKLDMIHKDQMTRAYCG